MQNSKITKIDWKVQDSTDQSVLFYFIGSHDSDEQKFYENIKIARYELLIINRNIKNIPDRCKVLDGDHFFFEQKRWLDKLYPKPEFKIFAITGTNGKTTTADLILQLGAQRGLKGFSIGTLGVKTIEGIQEEFGLTTPNYIELRKFFSKYGKNSDFCVIEASSHALEQKRFFDLTFDQAAWTSFSQDHLDYHKTMDEYFQAKMKIYSFLKPTAKLWVPSLEKKLIHRISQTNLVSAKERSFDSLPLFFSVSYNRMNLELAVNILNEVYGEFDHYNLTMLQSPEGRFLIKEFSGKYYVVDFAHTPDALENICRGIKENFPNFKLKVLFGCGGDRDKTKRPLMAQACLKYADYIYVTSDNPRSESPDKIIDDIIIGIDKSLFARNEDRKKMIEQALKELKKGEVLVLAGKGHENYILKNGIKEPHSDQLEAEKIIKDLSL